METNWVELKIILVNGKPLEQQEALIKIKDAVIGSNKQKAALISHGMVPLILNTVNDGILPEKVRVNALIILGSLAKGTLDQVEVLINEYNVIPVIIKEIKLANKEDKHIEICLSTICSLCEYEAAPIHVFFVDDCFLTYFLGLASTETSSRSQVCIVSILISICQTYEDQMRLLHVGAIHVLARMICVENEHIQLSALCCLSSLCSENRSISDNVCVTSFQGKSLLDLFDSLMSRLYAPKIQVAAAKCLANIYRSGTLPSTDPRIIHRTLPCLTRLCTEGFDQSVTITAIETLAYLLEVDAVLQRTAAISNHLLKSLSLFLQSAEPPLKQAALKCVASLAANDEPIRKRLIRTEGLMEMILIGLHDVNSQVVLASIRCLHSLSRSVYHLRTSFQDFAVWKPLLEIISGQPSLELIIAITSIFCNMLLSFSPSKELLTNEGILKQLCQLTSHTNPTVRLNCVWALMNMSFQGDYQLKIDIINNVGVKKLFELTCDSDVTIVIKTLGLLRNLLSKSYQIDLILNVYSAQLLEAVNMILDSKHSPDIKEQVLAIIANIAAKDHNANYIINDEMIMRHLGVFLIQTDQNLRAGALCVIRNIVNQNTSKEVFSRLIDVNIIRHVQELNKQILQNKVLPDDYTHKAVREIVIQCQQCFPDVTNHLTSL